MATRVPESSRPVQVPAQVGSAAPFGDSRRAGAELAALLGTCALFLGFENVLHLKLQFLIPSILGWTVYMGHRLARDPRLASQWGIRLDNWGAAAPPLLGFLAAGGAALLAWRLAFGWKPLPPGAWIIFMVYPLWAFLQQVVLQVLVASNLERLGLARPVIVPLAAALFGLAHFPHGPLMGLCAAGGLVWTAIYLRTRHLPLLALTHAWLGALAYYWVLERDPWREFFHH